jgi:hypothetical protein
MIKIDKEGIEISHNRYLTDTSTGWLILLNIALLVFFDIIKTDFLVNENEKILTINISIVILAFLLSTSIGLVISFISWLLLEGIYVEVIERSWWKSKYILSFLQLEKDFAKIEVDCHLTYDNWHSSLIEYEEKLTKAKCDLSTFQIQRGLRILIRNISFILIINSIIFFIMANWASGVVFFLLFAILLFISGSIGFYSNLGLTYKYIKNLGSTTGRL